MDGGRFVRYFSGVQLTFTRSYCRGEQRVSRFRFAGYATEHARENTVRPRAFYQQCATVSCGMTILTLADVPDAMGLCRAVVDEWLRKTGTGRVTATGVSSAQAGFDVENVLGEMYAYVWHLYSDRWLPAFGNGTGTFLGYATPLLRRKFHRFRTVDAGEPTTDRGGVYPKAHAATVSSSYEQLTEQQGDGERSGERGGMDAALGAVDADPVADRVQAGGWLQHARGSRTAGHQSGSGVPPRQRAARGDT